MMKKVQQISTMLPIGRSEERSVWTTNFRPGARLITLSGRSDRSSLKTRKIPKILGLDSLISDISRSTMEIVTSEPSMMFHPEVKYASGP